MSRSLPRLAPLAKRWLGAILAPAADPRAMAVAGRVAGGELPGLEKQQALLAQVHQAIEASTAARQRLESRIAALRERGQAGAVAPLERHRQQVQAQER